jgi:hypothetical protein
MIGELIFCGKGWLGKWQGFDPGPGIARTADNVQSLHFGIQPGFCEHVYRSHRTNHKRGCPRGGGKAPKSVKPRSINVKKDLATNPHAEKIPKKIIP